MHFGIAVVPAHVVFALIDIDYDDLAPSPMTRLRVGEADDQRTHTAARSADEAEDESLFAMDGTPFSSQSSRRGGADTEPHVGRDGYTPCRGQL